MSYIVPSTYNLITNEKKMNQHGGGFKKKGLDFSVNINPMAMSPQVHQALIEKLTDIHQYPEIIGTSAIQTLSEYYNMPKSHIILGNGAIELIYLYARALKPNKVIVISPTFNEYERAFYTVGSKVYHYVLEKNEQFQINVGAFIKEIKKITPECIVLCNPNNPTGQLLNNEAIRKISEAISQWKGFLMLDESFIELSTGKSSRELLLENVVCIQSLTKYYGVPGLRLGVAFGSSEFIDKMYRYKEPWTMNALALSAIKPLLNETNHQSIQDWLNREKDFLYAALNKMKGIKAFWSSTNFLLIHYHKAQQLMEALKMRQPPIYLRKCTDFIGLDETYIRIAVKSRADNDMLIQEIDNCLAKGD
ncbi:L-threonine O-3-phosphate decarboxylase [Natranaerovirga hydrolytica]|uniref:Aminotransferase n=1 Tax=Natranaerovirga hydrolytica TaxID=680378 RepID=A0A4R1N6H4_9FIRM|nr:histidinol-phosphate transaminase [Natranaerovirga hydrolytica]TCK98629.1 L-threonine O-3-phosphate decarboxylase [Natranaerovirga hydrolytica]